MGIGASKERTFGLSNENHLLYSPKLLDLEHGTIRHRDKELVEENKEEEVRQGYFYHAQLTDWADENCIKDFQKKIIVESTQKDQMFYVYAKGLESETTDHGIVKVKPKPKGLGYRWRGDSEHRYFRLRLSKIRENEESDSESEELQGYDTVYRIHPKEDMLAESLSFILSLKLLIPEDRIHIIYKTGKLEPSKNLKELSPNYFNSKLELKMLTDVEIVKNNYDTDETPPKSPTPGLAFETNGSESKTIVTSPTRDITSPTRDITSPTRDITSPTRDITSPTRDITSPTRDVTSPTRDITSPTRDITSPTRDITSPTRDITSPTRDITSPVRDVTSPVRDVTSPVRDVASPVRDVTSPVRDVTSPVRDVTSPVRGVSANSFGGLPGAIED